MICIDEEEWSGDVARKMLDAKVWLLVFYGRPIVNIAEHVCPHLCVVMCCVIFMHLP